MKVSIIKEKHWFVLWQPDCPNVCESNWITARVADMNRPYFRVERRSQNFNASEFGVLSTKNRSMTT